MLEIVKGCGARQLVSPTSSPYLAVALERAARAPWYRRTWPRRVSETSELPELPILERSSLVKHVDEFLTGLVPKPLRRIVTTSGSTGSPVTVWLDRSIS